MNPHTPALPRGVGVSLKAQHYRDALAGPRGPAFFEVHAENYLHPGGPAHRWLEAIRRDHRLSIHGVGLSLGGDEPPSRSALAERAALLRRYEPDVFSEHLAWSSFGGEYFNDLLPIACTPESLARVVALSPQATLDRGYAVVQDEDGHVVRDADAVEPGADLQVRLAAGTLLVTAD